MEKTITIKDFWLGKMSKNEKKFNSIVTTEDEFFNDFKELFTKDITLEKGKHYKIKYMTNGTFRNPLAIEESDEAPAIQPMEMPTNTQPTQPVKELTKEDIGTIQNHIAQRMEACKDIVETIFKTTIKERPELIPCVNSCFIDMSRRIR